MEDSGEVVFESSIHQFLRLRIQHSLGRHKRWIQKRIDHSHASPADQMCGYKVYCYTRKICNLCHKIGTSINEYEREEFRDHELRKKLCVSGLLLICILPWLAFLMKNKRRSCESRATSLITVNRAPEYMFQLMNPHQWYCLFRQESCRNICSFLFLPYCKRKEVISNKTPLQHNQIHKSPNLKTH